MKSLIKKAMIIVMMMMMMHHQIDQTEEIFMAFYVPLERCFFSRQNSTQNLLQKRHP